MWTRHHKQRRMGRLILPTACAAFIGYFGFHAWHGEYGINAKIEVEEREAALQARLSSVRAERQALERRVSMMHDGTLDRDLVDEQARRALNMSSADEITIMLGAGSTN